MNPIAPVSLPSASAASAATEANKDSKPKPEVLKAAREFEAIFLRSLLAPLEKSTQLSGRSQVAGQSAYGSMVVGALADSMSSAGGIGLTDIIAKAMMSRAGPHKGGG